MVMTLLSELLLLFYDLSFVTESDLSAHSSLLGKFSSERLLSVLQINKILIGWSPSG